MKIEKLFSENDLNEIRTSVQRAEANISGEIVPVIVEKCNSYGIAFYRAFILFAALAGCGIILIDSWHSPFIFTTPLSSLLTATVVGVIGACLLFIQPSLIKVFISEAMIEQCVRDWADRYFLHQELFATRARTGILIVLALFEKKVLIKADKGIAAVVEQKIWDEKVASFLAFTKQGDIKNGLIKLIEECGALLAEKGFVKTADDVNELPDEVRITR